MQNIFQKKYLVRCLILVISMIFSGLGMTIMRFSCMGTEPFSCLNYSISEKFGIPMTVSVIAINGVLLIFCLIHYRASFGIGTLLIVFLLGITGDFWKDLFIQIIGYQVSYIGLEKLLLRLCLMGLGMVIMVFFNSFCIAAGLGMAPYDAFGYAIEKMSSRKILFRYTRVITDFTCVLIAFLLSSTMGTQWELIGIGTVTMACGIGPLLSWLTKHVAEPFYMKLDERFR